MRHLFSVVPSRGSFILSALSLSFLVVSSLPLLSMECVVEDSNLEDCECSDSEVVEQWKSSRGTAVNLKQWGSYNLSPFRSYYKGDSKECVERWFISLGPIGVTTRMYDRSWGVFSAVKSGFDPRLCDAEGELIWNYFEVVNVKPGSPAEGVLSEGDLILAMNGEFLEGSQHRMIDEALGNRKVRGLEIHAGQLIDRAEATGALSLTVLPASANKQITKSPAKWSVLTTLEEKAGTKVDFEFPAKGVFRLTKAGNKSPNLSGLRVIGKNGVELALEPKRRVSFLNESLEVPGEGWSLKGEVAWGKASALQVEFRPDVEQPHAELLAQLKEVSLKLDAIGSFGERFDPKSEKVKNYSAMLRHRLLVQQSEDGSWQAGGYASHRFQTAICGLALLSTGEDDVLEAVERAAKFVANDSQADKWTYSNGTQLLFLAEYYHYTGDESILPSLRRFMTDARRFILSDFTAGHSYMRPGYGGSGYIGGGGVLTCGLAAACKTPVATKEDQALLVKMLQRVQEIAPAGLVPYGRGGKAKMHNEVRGQGGGCGTGPYFVGALIGGGPAQFTEAARTRFSTKPYGTAENGHASQTLHFFWGVLSSCRSSAQARQDVMSAYLWKFTTLREYDGFINKNNYRVEYHNGDGVVGEPYWRTAAYLILMNAHKQKVAITGKPNLQTKEPVSASQLYHAHKATKLALLRNWGLVDAHLGDASPASLKAGIELLSGLDEDEKLDKALVALYRAEAPKIAREVAKLPKSAGGHDPQMLAGLVLGIYFEGLCTPDLMANLPPALEGDKKGTKKFLSKEAKRLANAKEGDVFGHRIAIVPRTMIQAGELGSSEQITDSLLKVTEIKVGLADPSSKLLKKVLRADGPEGLKAGILLPVREQFALKVKISYQCAGLNITYVTDFPVPAPEARSYVPVLERVAVEGTMSADYYGSYSMGIALSSGQKMACEQRSEPAPYLLTGQRYEFQISPGSQWGHDLRSVKLLGPAARELKFAGDAALSDGDPTTGVMVQAGQPQVIELKEAAAIKSVYLDWSEQKLNHQIEAWVDDQWKLISPRGNPGLRPCDPVVTKKLRITLSQGSAELREVRLISPDPENPDRVRIW